MFPCTIILPSLLGSTFVAFATIRTKIINHVGPSATHARDCNHRHPAKGAGLATPQRLSSGWVVLRVGAGLRGLGVAVVGWVALVCSPVVVLLSGFGFGSLRRLPPALLLVVEVPTTATQHLLIESPATTPLTPVRSRPIYRLSAVAQAPSFERKLVNRPTASDSEAPSRRIPTSTNLL